VLKKILSLALVAALALVTVPAPAQTAVAGQSGLTVNYGPSTVWGIVPDGLKPYATTALLKDASGAVVQTKPVVDGLFEFTGVGPGYYVVVLQNNAGAALATSETVDYSAVDRAIQAFFPSDKVPAAYVPPPSGTLSTTGWIVVGAAAVGITAAIIAVSDDGESKPPISPSR
jgi:hypothetical protein